MCVYRKMVDSGGVPGKGIILASIEKTIPASTGNGSNLCEYRKRVESGRVPGKGRIRESIEKYWNPSEYRENVESLLVSKNYPG